MTEYYVGKYPEFDDCNLFSESPFVVHFEATLGKDDPETDGSVHVHMDIQFRAFSTMSEARQFCRNHKDPDKRPESTTIYAFASGEWKKVGLFADSN
jgi:hypothetical protein